MKTNWYAARDAAKKAGGTIESSEEGSYAIWRSKGGNIMAYVQSQVFSGNDGQAHTFDAMFRGSADAVCAKIEARKDCFLYIWLGAVRAVRTFAELHDTKPVRVNRSEGGRPGVTPWPA